MRTFLSFVVATSIAIPAVAAPRSSDVAESAKKIVGAWKLEFTTPDDVDRSPIVLVGREHQKFVAWYVEKDKKPESFKRVRLEGDKLMLTIRPKERKDIEVTFEASLKKENVCAGEATYRSDDGDSGSWDFKGQRVAKSDFDEMQNWQLSFVTPDDQKHEATVTVAARKDKLYGWYSSKDFDIPATKLDKDGSKITLSLTTKTKDGMTVDVTFRGTVDGDHVKGEAKYDLEGDTGSFPFTGKRKS